ncbi:MAG: sugar ABC transporter permease [Candidatus Calescibacterium sp.]|nr:sugar ABC transporter permease [Candidatus Calescibacterium sp.]MCX7971634.1 sugar ABC transporter permease [bacterium]MDW8195842.1 sugar ABC transporter permease [Candidatus Calescibacterium sp.]
MEVKKDLIVLIINIITLTLLFVFVIYPFIKIFVSSFYTEVIYLDLKKFVFLDNYYYILTDSNYWNSLYNSLKFSFATFTIQVILGFLIALLMWKNENNKLLRISILIPWALPTAIIALSWRFMLNEEYGIIPKFFDFFNIENIFLSNFVWAFIWMVIIDVWKTTPFIVIMFYSALKGINKELFEALDIEKASWHHKVFWVILPLCIPAISSALLFRLLYAMVVFDLPYVLTGGGPANSTKTLPMYIYENFFKYLDIGYASSLTVFSILIIFVISISFLGILKKIYSYR